MDHPSVPVKTRVLSQCKVSLCILGGTGEYSGDDPTLSGNTFFQQLSLSLHHSLFWFTWCRTLQALTERNMVS